MKCTICGDDFSTVHTCGGAASFSNLPAPDAASRNNPTPGRMFTLSDITGLSMAAMDRVEKAERERDVMAAEVNPLRRKADMWETWCRPILENMAQENTGWIRFFRRWPISHEPLRSDARNALTALSEAGEQG